MVYSLFPVRRDGRTHKIRRIGPAGYKSSFAAGREAPRSNRAAELVARTWRCSSVRVRARLPSNRITKQSQFPAKPCFPDTYGKFGGLIASAPEGRRIVAHSGAVRRNCGGNGKVGKAPVGA